MTIPVLLVEDTPSLQFLYRSVLTSAGINVQVASTAADGLRVFRAVRPGVVLLDLGLPDRDGLALMSEMLALDPQAYVVVISAQGSVDRAVAAMRAGAFDFLLKPFEESRFLAAARSAMTAAAEARAEAADLPARQKKRRADPVLDQGVVIGSSEVMQDIHRVIGSVAGSIATVFITGESGTGKELAALALHNQSGRSGGPFIALNCGAIPHDLLESEVFGHVKGSFTGAIADKPGAAAAAHGGTLFLDEVCEMAPALQTKFLRFLQTSTVQPLGATWPRKVDVRIVCATNRDPFEAVRSGAFREDLFYRLHVVSLHLPALRERGQDILEIARSALARFGGEEGKSFAGFSEATEAILLNYAWPGNVRQLLNVMRNVAVLHPGGIVTPDMLPLLNAGGDLSLRRSLAAGALPSNGASAQPAEGAPLGDMLAGMTLAEIERQAVEAALDRHDGSVPRAARELDISVSTLYRRIESWKIRRENGGN